MVRPTTVRMAVVGLGAMGREHARAIATADDATFSLAAVIDTDAAVAERIGRELSVPWFDDLQPVLDNGLADAVLIATPHYLHPPLAIRAAQAGLHVLCEKPLAVEVGPARAMVKACERHGVALAVMYQTRLSDPMLRLKRMVDDGELGAIQQITMIATNWYRTQAYYGSGGWRGTWGGEGGGVLMNQAPHNLDQLLWLFGSPSRVAAFLATRQHRIEVENTANIICQFDNGAAAYLYFSTAEVPRREQLLVCGNRATVSLESGRLQIARLSEPISHHIMQCTERRADYTPDPAHSWEAVPMKQDCPDELRRQIIRNFVGHIVDGTPLVATGRQAALQVELTNAIYLAGFGGQIVELPMGDSSIAQVESMIDRLASQGPRDSVTSLRDLAHQQFTLATATTLPETHGHSAGRSLICDVHADPTSRLVS